MVDFYRRTIHSDDTIQLMDRLHEYPGTESARIARYRNILGPEIYVWRTKTHLVARKRKPGEPERLPSGYPTNPDEWVTTHTAIQHEIPGHPRQKRQHRLKKLIDYHGITLHTDGGIPLLDKKKTWDAIHKQYGARRIINERTS